MAHHGGGDDEALRRVLRASQSAEQSCGPIRPSLQIPQGRSQADRPTALWVIGGNDGSAFVPYGSVDIALGWPLRYSHSPAEVIDTRDVDSLARIVAAIAKSW